MEPRHLNLYFREIVYHHPRIKKDSVCGVFSYEALNVEDANLGNLYLVGKISNVPPKKYRNSDFLLNLLASAIKREFYSNHQRTSLEALESALQSANIYLNDFSQKGHKEWVGNLHFACLVSSQNNIHIGQTGNIIIQLFRGSTISSISKKFKNQEENPEPSKTFSNIASGKIEEGDKVIISTSDISNILTTQKIKELISHPTTDKLYHYIKDILEQKNKVKEQTPNSLACLILEAETKAPIEKEKISVAEENPIEFSLDFKKILEIKSDKISRAIKKRLTFPNKLTLFLISHHAVKYLLALFLIVLIILSPYVIGKINYDFKIGRINNLIERARENIKRSEISLTYQNQNEAQIFLRQTENLINKAESILEKLSEEAKYEPKQKLLSVINEFEKQKNSTNNIINISQPEKIADLSNNTYTFNPEGILKLENNLYLYELTSGFLYKIDLTNNSPTLVFLSSKDTFKMGAVTENAVLLLANPEKVSSYNIDEAYNIYLLKPNLENTFNIKDMTSYGDALFFLDVQKMNIWRYAITESVFNGAGWLKAPSDELINAQSIAVDGNIFVSKENGIIIEYSQGKKLREIKFNINPLLSKGGQLFTKAEMKNLYVLDPPNNRIISFNKKDGLIKQYSIPDLNNLKDFWVDISEETIYLLNGLEIYRIEI